MQDCKHQEQIGEPVAIEANPVVEVQE